MWRSGRIMSSSGAAPSGRPASDLSLHDHGTAALALICNARFSLLLVLVAFTPVLIMRVRLEEAALMEKFGEAYGEYRRTTPALIPCRGEEPPISGAGWSLPDSG